jgi:hypothetical protein
MDVGAAVDLLGSGLLRGHVGDLALELSRPRHREPRRRPCDPEVGDSRDAVDADQDVVRRHVAMNDLQRPPVVVGPLVRRVQAGEGVEDDAHGDPRRDRLLLLRGAVEQVSGRVALDVLHHEVVAGSRGANFQDRDDVRVVDPRGQTRLVEEHLDELAVPRQVLVQPLDGVKPLKTARAPEPGEKDRPHPPACELRDELEPIELRSNHFRHDDEAPRLGADPLK